MFTPVPVSGQFVGENFQIGTIAKNLVYFYPKQTEFI